VAAILTGMVTPPTPVPPPRRESRRFPIPTPADLRHPRQLRAPADESAAPDGTIRAAAPGGEGGTAAAASTERAGSGAGSEPAPPDPVVPTPGTLPRPRSTPRAAPAQPTTDEPDRGGQGAGRRSFPNPATLMAAGRGARKVRPSGLRARRLPKVEETSAGGVVLDLAADPPAVALIARHDRRSRLLWSLPKGHVEEGETPEIAALREVQEETGLEGRIIAPLGVIDFWFVVEDKRIHKTVHHFVIEAIGGELSDEDIEVEAVEWIPYDQVVRRLAYGDERRLVEKVAQIVPGLR
jgi:ADP-ribose pyrophosphatase YjhB (NUDIX family)